MPGTLESPEEAMVKFGDYYIGMTYNLECGDDYSNIVETTTNIIIGRLQRNKQGLWFNLPFHVYKKFTDNILNRFDVINKPEDFDNSIYGSLFQAWQYDEINKYLFYLSMSICDYYNLDMYNSLIFYNENGIFIEGRVDEWVINDEIEKDDVIYLINIEDNHNSISIKKIFNSDIADVEIIMDINEFNKEIINELKEQII